LAEVDKFAYTFIVVLAVGVAAEREDVDAVAAAPPSTPSNTPMT